MTIKRKIALTLLLLVNTITMFLSWFGSGRGVQEIKGTIVLFKPITLLCIALFVVGIWYPVKKINNWMCLLSISVIIGVEIYEFIFWHYKTITGKVDLLYSFKTAYAGFYIGFMISFTIFLLYIFRSSKKRFSKL